MWLPWAWVTGASPFAECAVPGFPSLGLSAATAGAWEDFVIFTMNGDMPSITGLCRILSKETITFRNTGRNAGLAHAQASRLFSARRRPWRCGRTERHEFRFSPHDFQIKTMTDERYGKNKLGKEYILQDYPSPTMRWEPYYTVEMAPGVAGEPGISAVSVPSRMPCLLWVKTPVLSKFETAAKQTGVPSVYDPRRPSLPSPIPRRTASRTIRACTAGSASASAG